VAEIEKGLDLLSDDLVTSYISDLGQALAAQSARSSLAYHFKVVDTSEINAFTLPGGFVYVNRGLIDAADNEGELVGVMGRDCACRSTARCRAGPARSLCQPRAQSAAVDSRKRHRRPDWKSRGRDGDRGNVHAVHTRG